MSDRFQNECFQLRIVSRIADRGHRRGWGRGIVWLILGINQAGYLPGLICFGISRRAVR